MRRLLLVLPIFHASPGFAHVGSHTHLSKAELFGHAADMSHVGAAIIAAFLAIAAGAIIRAVRARVRATTRKGPRS